MLMCPGNNRSLEGMLRCGAKGRAQDPAKARAEGAGETQTGCSREKGTGLVRGSDREGFHVSMIKFSEVIYYL